MGQRCDDRAASDCSRCKSDTIRPSSGTTWWHAMALKPRYLRHPASRCTRSARRTALGSVLITSISPRAAPEGRRAPNSHLRTVPTPVPISAANSRCVRPSASRAARVGIARGHAMRDRSGALAGGVIQRLAQARADVVRQGWFAPLHFLRHCLATSFTRAGKSACPDRESSRRPLPRRACRFRRDRSEPCASRRSRG